VGFGSSVASIRPGLLRFTKLFLDSAAYPGIASPFPLFN
jgi:hypothetical protein